MKVGDVVRLRSGSPTLTVKSFLDRDIKVCWINESEIREFVAPVECFVPEPCDEEE